MSLDLEIEPAAVSVAQGSNVTATATVTRSAGAAGRVSVVVLNSFPGVTAVASNFQSQGPVTSANVSVNAAPTAATGTFTFVLRAQASGSGDASANLQVTVTPGPAIAVSLSTNAVTIQRGTSNSAVVVSITRTAYSGPVQLLLVDTNYTLPAGITASFDPNPAVGNSAVLTINVGNAATVGTYDLFVVGVITGLFEAGTGLRITVI